MQSAFWRRAFLALTVCCAALTSGVLPVAAQEFPFCIKGCDFGSGRGDCEGPDGLLRRQPLLQRPCRIAAQPQPDVPQEALMRIVALAALAIAATSMTGPARAQTYDPDYPVCLHVYGKATYYECRYTSLPQCNLSASGRAAH